MSCSAYSWASLNLDGILYGTHRTDLFYAWKERAVLLFELS